MRYFIVFFAVLLISLPALAVDPVPAAVAEEAPQQEPPQTPPGHTPVNDEMAKAYYDSCMGQRDQRMSNEAQDSLCTCTAEKMKTAMSVEQIRTMGQNDQDGRNMLNKMLLDVYAPCMAEPLAEIIEDQCRLDEKMEVKGMHKTELCACVAQKTGEWFTVEGRDAMAEVLAGNPNISDPISPVMESPGFKEKSFANMLACAPVKKSRK